MVWVFARVLQVTMRERVCHYKCLFMKQGLTQAFIGFTFSWKLALKVYLLVTHRVQLFETPWTVAHPASLSMELKYAAASAKSLQSCLTLFDPMDHNLRGSSVHGILQATVLGWVAIPFSRGSSQHRDRTQVFSIAGRFFTIWATWEAWKLVLELSRKW